MLRLIFVLPSLVLLLLLGSAALLLLAAFRGSPGACGGGRELRADPALAEAYDARWLAFNNRITFGQIATIIVTEDEATARARKFLEDHDAPVDDVRVCFVPGAADVNGTISTPFGADIAVRMKGSADLTGLNPEARIDSIRIGNVPGWMTRPFRGLVTRIVDDQMEQIILLNDMTVDLRDREAEINGTP